MNSPDTNSTAYSDPTGPGTTDLIPLVMRLLRIFRYRKKIIFASLYFFILAGIIYYFFATRYYQSSAKLLIVEQKIDQPSSMGESDSTGNTMATHRELVISPVVIKNAINKLPQHYRVDLIGVSPKNWVKAIGNNLSASTTRKTNFINVSFRSKRPEAASAVVSAAIQSYLEFVEKHHRGAASDVLAVLHQERDQLQQDLNQKQLALQHFRQKVGHLAISSDDGIVEPMIQRAIRLNEALLDAQEKRLALQTNFASIQQAVNRGEDVTQQLMSIESSLGKQMMLTTLGISPQDLQVMAEQRKKLLESQDELRILSSHYGPNHPRISELEQQINSINNYLGNYHTNVNSRSESFGKAIPSEIIIKMLKQAVDQALQQERQLLASFEQARAEAAQHSDALVQLRMLERDVIRNEALYDSLSEKIAGIDTSQGQAPIKATVVSEPLPNNIPVTPRLRFLAILCLCGGTATGALVAYVQDVLDDRFNSPEELSTQLGVPVLSIVRNLDQLPGEGLETVHTNSMPTSVETEAFRTLRTSISLGGDVCDRILISSSEPGDGKTTISANLSVAFAQAGKKTLVIDADLRKPGFSTLLKLKGQPGVADVLSSDMSPEESAPPLIFHTEVDGLDVLPVGLRRPNPAELLSSNAFVELLAWADSRYDKIIVDCPPVLAVSDAQIVGQLVDGAILVVRPEKNHRRSVIRAVESFHNTGCRVIGVVANGLSNDSSGYGYGYGYGYGDSYGHYDEIDAVESDTIPLEIVAKKEKSIRPRRAA